ncbi:predicted protein [Botrytis cinerea T4]|uniref:Uncharacterized protein n=1 Tax=Botryotinia fuckeliana (strain T4) TaxID=999810 RepID=G2YEK6_BOTF4|nr:predicted protein [Botrytis cinerea T4]
MYVDELWKRERSPVVGKKSVFFGRLQRSEAKRGILTFYGASLSLRSLLANKK